MTAQRNETTVASQSLFLLNSPFVREQARAWPSDSCPTVRSLTRNELSVLIIWCSAEPHSPTNKLRPANSSPLICRPRRFKIVPRKPASSLLGRAIANRCCARMSFCTWSDQAMTIPLSRRTWLQRSACGFGNLALLSLLADDARASDPQVAGPLAPRQPHHPAGAKRVAFLFMHGGVSHVDSFDNKPKLTEQNGRPLPFAKPKFEFAPTGNLLASPWKFQKYGQSGIEVSELFPQIAARIDDICVIRSMNGGDQVSHGPALLNINTGSGVFARPSLGAGRCTAWGPRIRICPGSSVSARRCITAGVRTTARRFCPPAFKEPASAMAAPTSRTPGFRT